MRFPFESEEAQKLNREIFDTIYFAALEASCELAEKNGPYETYEGSPVSKGVSNHNHCLNSEGYPIRKGVSIHNHHLSSDFFCLIPILC